MKEFIMKLFHLNAVATANVRGVNIPATIEHAVINNSAAVKHLGSDLFSGHFKAAGQDFLKELLPEVLEEMLPALLAKIQQKQDEANLKTETQA